MHPGYSASTKKACEKGIGEQGLQEQAIATADIANSEPLQLYLETIKKALKN